MGFILSSALKDLARWRQDLNAILLWLGIPFIVGGLLLSMMDGDGAKPQGTLLIVDQDDSLVSGLVAGAFAQDQLGDLIITESVGLDSGMARIDAGEASGLLIIPEGFGQALIESTPVTLTLRTNPSQTILPGIIRDVTEVLLDAGFYVHQLFGDEISQVMDSSGDGAPNQELVLSIAANVQQTMESVAPRLFPPAIELSVIEPPPEEPGPSLAVLFLPGIILIGMLFSASSLAGDFWVEKEQGTLRRLVAAPDLMRRFLTGKALAATLIIASIAALAAAAGFLYLDLPWHHFLPSLAWLALSGLALFAWFSVLQTAFPNQQAASIVSMVVLFPLLMAGGSFFPLAVLPGWIAAIGRLSPNGFMVDRLTTELTSSSAWAIDLQSWAILAGLAVSGLALCSWRLGAFSRS